MNGAHAARTAAMAVGGSPQTSTPNRGQPSHLISPRTLMVRVLRFDRGSPGPPADLSPLRADAESLDQFGHGSPAISKQGREHQA